jgi:uncharacterized protein (TIGR03086 family)
MTSIDQRPAHRHAIEQASSYVARIGADDLGRPTPCADWNLQQLLDHMVGQHLGFAAVVRDGVAGPEAYAPHRFTPASWQTSVDALLAAFAGADLDAMVVEVELHPVRPLPVSSLVAAQWLDTVVHTWDIAAALGESFTPTADVAAAMAQMATAIPDDERRDRPGAAFGHGVVGDDSPWGTALAALGRDVGWKAQQPLSPREGEAGTPSASLP